MHIENNMRIEFDGVSGNEAFARSVVSAFVAPLDPTIEELTEIKTALSEAVSNSVIHGYDNKEGKVRIECSIRGNVIELSVEDDGDGIEDVEKAREPLYTTKPEQERSGMGFTVMEIFMDYIQVDSEPGKGTRVTMKKQLER